MKKKERGITLIELIIALVIIAMFLGVLGKCAIGIRSFDSASPISLAGPSIYEKKLRGASQIEIQEKTFHLEKYYEVYVEGEKVAQVTGKKVRFVGGDVFTLTASDGKVLASEEECKRFFRLSRAAICYDGSKKLTGYIGEESIKDFFSLSYVFHFYDSNKNEIGKSKKLGKSVWNRHKLYDTEGNEDYDIDKKLGSLITGADRYILTRLDFESSIPLEYAVFIACIEDAIADAHS
ncbi:MAG: prepilin-type N-terminal cleavage/methylation domain-containing protein [Nanoarchaeota archaeon]|nr:prepilin-type N-terminal cleavage/methylation domain-containing protein [Nanoarchaeota archaeon]